MSAKYARLEHLGAGTSGVVYLVEKQAGSGSGARYVLKEVDMEKFDAKDVQHAMAEVSVLAALDHPNIVHHKESFVENNKLYIVMEYADAGDLDAMIKDQREVGMFFDEDRILRWFTQLCLALKHVHDRKVLHRDLKTQNVFLAGNGRVKLGDFGLTSVLCNTLAVAETRLGTPYYMSPELCQGIPYTAKNDVWGLGCVLYKLCALKHPFNAKTLKSLIKNICTKKAPSIPEHYSRDLQKLAAWLLQKNPDERPSIDQVLRTPVIRTIAKELLVSPVYGDDEHGRHIVTRQLRGDGPDGASSGSGDSDSDDANPERAFAVLAKKHEEITHGAGAGVIELPTAHKHHHAHHHKKAKDKDKDKKKKKKGPTVEDHAAGLEDLREEYHRRRREKEKDPASPPSAHAAPAAGVP